MDFNFQTPYDLVTQIAKQAKERRLFLNLTQHSLSERSGVSLGVLKKFERTGKISIESLLKIAVVLDSLSEFSDLFKSKPLESYPTLDQLLKQKSRMRGRQ